MFLFFLRANKTKMPDQMHFIGKWARAPANTHATLQYTRNVNIRFEEHLFTFMQEHAFNVISFDSCAAIRALCGLDWKTSCIVEYFVCTT